MITKETRQAILNEGYEADRLRSDPFIGPALVEIHREAMDALVAVNATDADTIRTHQATVKVVQAITERIATAISRAQQIQSNKPVA